MEELAASHGLSVARTMAAPTPFLIIMQCQVFQCVFTCSAGGTVDAVVVLVVVVLVVVK